MMCLNSAGVVVGVVGMLLLLLLLSIIVIIIVVVKRRKLKEKDKMIIHGEVEKEMTDLAN